MHSTMWPENKTLCKTIKLNTDVELELELLEKLAEPERYFHSAQQLPLIIQSFYLALMVNNFK